MNAADTISKIIEPERHNFDTQFEFREFLHFDQYLRTKFTPPLKLVGD